VSVGKYPTEKDIFTGIEYPSGQLSEQIAMLTRMETLGVASSVIKEIVSLQVSTMQEEVGEFRNATDISWINNLKLLRYAMERTNSAIKVWFWTRNDGSVPSDVKNGASSINTSNWGTPFANFPNTQCSISSKFGPNNIVINLTFCGDWAGAVFASQGCGSDCVCE